MACLLVATAGTCQAQAPNEVADYIRSWNQKKSAYERSAFDQVFNESLAQLAEGRPGTWRASRANLWQALPPELKPELPISPNGSAFLLSLFAENVEGFNKQVSDPDERRRLVDAKLYLVLSLAQPMAQQMRQESIEPSQLFVAIANAWTGLWPICPQVAGQLR
jgi:hypothetical protein